MDELEWDPDEDDESLAAWDEVDRQAADLVAEACRGVLEEPPQAEVAQVAAAFRAAVDRGGWPYDYFRHACAWTNGVPDEDDVAVWLTGIAATISPLADPQTDIEERAAVGALQHADWVALVLGLERGGVGTHFDADGWYDALTSLPEIENDELLEDDPDDYAMPVEVLAPQWQALGVLDDDRLLTEAGRWGLPAALVAAWGGEESAGADGGGLDEAQVATALQLLADQPMALEDLRGRLARDGIFIDARELSRSLIWREEVFEFDDGLWGHLPTLVEGSVLSHRLTERERELGVVDPAFDLGLFDFLAMDGMALVDGGRVTERHRSRGEQLPVGTLTGLTGPEGWLDDFAPGDLVGFRYVGGELALERVEPVDDDTWTDQLVALARGLAQQAEAQDQPGVTTLDLALMLVREHPGALSVPRAPWSELLAVAGLELHLGSVGLPGTDWYAVPDWLRQDEQLAYRRWREALLRYHVGHALPPDELVELAAGLRGVVEELAAADASRDPDRVAPLLTAMLEASSGAERATPLYLTARVAEANGDGARMRELVEAAVGADPGHRDALADLAELRALAGDAHEAKRLYSLAQVDSQLPEVQILRKMVEPPPGPGRNKPCPCGSGKKYKVCHGRTERHPLHERGAWLRVKAKVFLQRGVNREELLGWAERWTGSSSHDSEVVRSAMDDPFSWDLAMFDGGVLASFLRLHGPLLPEDERELVERWLDSERRLLEVLQARPGVGIRARDLLNGEELDVPDRVLSREVRAKNLLYGRLLDEGDGVLRLWDDPLGVPRTLRARLVDLMRARADTLTIIRFLSGGDTPELRTTEGEEMLLCRTRYDVPDVDAVWARLAEALDEDGDQLQDMVHEGDDLVVRGTISREGGRLTLETLSLERMRRLQAKLIAVVPDARMVDESTRDPRELVGELTGARGAGEAELPLSPEDVEQIVVRMEDRWLSEEIPALGGLTPREAAADESRRPELLALLDDFEWRNEHAPAGAMVMDVRRLRVELGLA